MLGAVSGDNDCTATRGGGASEGGRYSIAAVDRALDLMQALARIGPASLAELAKEARCTRTAGFRLLRTMEARGFAIQDRARGSWRLGARWGGLGRAAADQGALAAVALPIMAELSRAQRETVYLRVRDGMESVTIAALRADEGQRLYTEVGARRPLHAGAGRLLLAHAPETVQRQILAQRLPRFTSATRTDPEWILADVKRILSRGWLLTSEEVEEGAVSVAAPVRDSTDAVIAALFLAGPAPRLRPPRARELVVPVLHAAEQLSLALGAAPSTSAADAAPPLPFGIMQARSARPIRNADPSTPASSHSHQGQSHQGQSLSIAGFHRGGQQATAARKSG